MNNTNTTKQFRDEFTRFLKDNLKTSEPTNEIAKNHFEKLQRKSSETGSNCYELSQFETKSKNTECFYFQEKVTLENEETEEYSIKYLAQFEN